MKTSDIQRALAALGFDPGPADGIWGRKSAASLRAFQTARGLTVDGIAGPETLARLFPQTLLADDGLDQPDLVWFQEARRLIGTREKPGAGSNPAILDWAEDLKIDYAGDDIAWCGLFVGHCIAATLEREPLPKVVLRARDWLNFGRAAKPAPGAILVFWRESRNGGKGHVGFYAGEDKTAFRVLGGNQSDSVSLAWIGRDRLIEARWPSSVPLSGAGPIEVARTATLSWNEA